MEHLEKYENYKTLLIQDDDMFRYLVYYNGRCKGYFILNHGETKVVKNLNDREMRALNMTITGNYFEYLELVTHTLNLEESAELLNNLKFVITDKLGGNVTYTLYRDFTMLDYVTLDYGNATALNDLNAECRYMLNIEKGDFTSYVETLNKYLAVEDLKVWKIKHDGRLIKGYNGACNNYTFKFTLYLNDSFACIFRLDVLNNKVEVPLDAKYEDELNVYTFDDYIDLVERVPRRSEIA